MKTTYQCSNCLKTTELAYTKLRPQTFACPDCFSVSFINESTTEYAGKLNGKFKNVYAELNETIVYKGKTYYIVGICTKTEKGSYVDWNEYILSDYDGNLIFLAHGSDFNSFLEEVELTPAMQEQLKVGGTINYKTSGYDFDFAQYAQTVAAKGIFFNKIFEESYNRTFQNTYYDTKFLSVEKYNDVTEVFHGEYLNKTSFRKLFVKEREVLYNNNSALKNLTLFFALISLVMGLLHFVLNYNNIDSFTYKNSIVKTNTTVSQFISAPFKVVGNDKKVKLSFISEVQNDLVTLDVSLVNQKTNATYVTETFKHFANIQNHASGNEITFCDVDAGTYHLAFHYSAPTNMLATNYDVDYTIKIGGVSNAWLYIAVILAFLVGYLYYTSIVNRNHIKNVLNFNDMLRYNNHEVFKYAIGIIVVYMIGNFLFISNYTCNSSKVNTELENASYTGNRTHFISRTYSSGASHK